MPSDKPSRVFVINDDPAQLRIAGKIIEKAGHKAIPFSGAESALKALQEGDTPDLIITDLYMLGIDGWRLCRLLRSPAFPSTHQTPIIVMSATFAGADAQQITQQIGASAFVSAPYSPSELTGVMQTLLRGRADDRSLVVLVVEDSEAQRTRIAEAFRNQGYQVLEAQDGESARKKHAAYRPGVVVMGHHLPDTSAEELLPLFRFEGSDRVVVVTTDDPSPQLAVDLLRDGADVYIRKPYDVAYLLDQVTKALRERGLLRVEEVLEERNRQLRTSEARYRAIVEDQTELIFRSLPDGTLTFVNDALCRYFGKERDQLIGQPFALLVAEEDREKSAKHPAMLSEQNPVASLQHRVLDSEGDTRWLQRTDRALFDEQGRLVEFQSVARDTTERKRMVEQLLDNEELLRATLESAADGILVLDETGHITHTNARFYEIWGVPKTLITKKDDRKLLQFLSRQLEDPETLGAGFEEPYETAEEAVGVLRLKDRRVFAYCSCPLVHGGKIAGRVWGFRDITRSKQAEDALRESERKYRLISENTSDLICVTTFSLKAVHTYVSPSAKKILGYDPEEMIGKSGLDFVHPDDKRKYLPLFRKYLARKARGLFSKQPVDIVETIEYRMKHKSGDWVCLESTVNPIGDHSLLFVSKEITQRKRAETELKRRAALDRVRAAASRMTSSQDFLHVVTSLHEAMKDAAPALEDCSVQIVDEKRGGFTVAWQARQGTHWMGPDRAIPQPLKDTAVYAAWSVHQVIYRRDLDKEDPYGETALIRESYGKRIRSVVDVPFSVGTIAANSSEPNAFSEADVEMLQQLAGVLSEAYARSEDIHSIEDSERKYRSVVEHAREGIVVAQDGRARYSNPAMSEILGYSNAELQGKPLGDLVHPQDREMVLQNHRDRLEGKPVPERYPFRAITKTGEVRWVEVGGVLIEWDGKPAALNFLSDITDSRQAAQALRESEERYRALFENSTDFAFVLDLKGNFTDVNKAAERLAGYPRRELIGMNFRRYAAPQTHRHLLRAFRHVYTSGEAVQDLPVEVVAKGGRRKLFEISFGPMYRGEEIVGFHGISRDVTDQRDAQGALQRAHDELELRVKERTAELTAANIHLARAARHKDEFLASMSHELRTPLSAVLGMSESLLEEVYGTVNEQQAKSLRTIEQSGRRLLELINDILDMAKIGAGRLKLNTRPISVKSTCESALRLVSQSAESKKLKLSSTVDSAVTILVADGQRMKQILANLLSNAVKFTPDGGSVGLEVVGHADQQVVAFTVWDTGIGITPEGLSSLFEPFVQLDGKLSRQYAGTGLGLSLVRHLAELHGGQVSAQSQVGKGSRFTVTIPWRETAQEEDDTQGVNTRM